MQPPDCNTPQPVPLAYPTRGVVQDQHEALAADLGRMKVAAREFLAALEYEPVLWATVKLLAARELDALRKEATKP